MALKWGQHFLIRQGVVEKMLKHANISQGDNILEIGPGKGFLTYFMLLRGAKVRAVEVDQQLCLGLRTRFKDQSFFSLLEADIMKLDGLELMPDNENSIKIVANLPYSISSTLILKLIPFRQSFTSMTVMVQQEVADRICASTKNRKQYGALSLASGMAFECSQILKVPPAAFRPPPKVNSAVVHMVPKDSGMGSEAEKNFLDWSHRLFGNRRKSLVNSIQLHYPDWYKACVDGLKDTFGLRRAEDLSLNEWIILFKDYEIKLIEKC